MLAEQQKSILKSSDKYKNDIYNNISNNCNICNNIFLFLGFTNNSKKISFEKNANTYYYNNNEIFHKNDKHIVILK